MTKPDPVITGSEFKESLLFLTDEGGWMVAFKRRQVELKAYLDSKNVTLEMMRTSDVVCFEAKLLVIALFVELEFYKKWQNGELYEQVNGENNGEAMVVEDQENDVWYEDNRDTTIGVANIGDHGDGGLKGGEKTEKKRGADYKQRRDMIIKDQGDEVDNKRKTAGIVRGQGGEECQGDGVSVGGLGCLVEDGRERGETCNVEANWSGTNKESAVVIGGRGEEAFGVANDHTYALKKEVRMAEVSGDRPRKFDRSYARREGKAKESTSRSARKEKKARLDALKGDWEDDWGDTNQDTCGDTNQTALPWRFDEDPAETDWGRISLEMMGATGVAIPIPAATGTKPGPSTRARRGGLRCRASTRRS